MDPTQFFDAILPSAGLRVMAIPYPTGGYKHVFHDTNEALANALAYVDGKGQTVYYGVASFQTANSREQTNVEAVRSFWLDLDAGEGKPYANAKEAAVALLAFVRTLGLPKPFVVSSGRGLHVYWAMSEDMSPAEWRPVAQALKAACRENALAADPARTADHASVLRPPGSTHRKGAPQPVVVVQWGEVSEFSAFRELLADYAEATPGDAFTLGPMPVELMGLANETDDLIAGIEHRERKSWTAPIADQCGVIGMIRDGKGDTDQATWYAAVGVLAFTEDGKDYVHKWSSGHPGYDPNSGYVDQKFAQAATKRPTLCARMGELQPAICAVCPKAGSIRTPWTLGVSDVPPVTVVIEQVITKEDGTFGSQLAEVSCPLIGFSWSLDDKDRKVMNRAHWEINEEGVGVWVYKVFCETMVYPTSRLWIDDEGYIEFEMIVRGTQTRKFVVANETIGKGGAELIGALASNEVLSLEGQERHMEAYLKKWMTHLKDTASQVEAHDHFGWRDDGSFVIGTSVLHPGGGETRGVVRGMAKSKAPALVPKGDLETWVDVIDRAYNGEGQEGYQFLVTSSFASPLLRMMGQVSGVTVYAHSEGSGVGKTTAQRAGLSAWGNWDDLQLADNKVTTNALWALMGAYHSLPVVFDELTNQKNDMASDLVFSVSSGRAKQRMNVEGGVRTNNANWCTILLASGNNLLSEKLALHRGNAEAEISRLFEFTLRATPRLTPNEAMPLFAQLMTNYGHAGRAFMRYVVDNYAQVQSTLIAVQKALNEELGITQMERYWSALLACNLVALTLCRKLNLVQFDVAAMKTWMVLRLEENRGNRNEAAQDPLELIGSMLAELWPGILVTEGQGNLRQKGGMAHVLQKPYGTMTGRAIMPLTPNDKPVLYINIQEIRNWSNEKGISAKEMFDAAVAAKWVEVNVASYALGSGTLEYSAASGTIRCWKFDPERISRNSFGSAVAQRLNVVRTDAAAGDARQ